MGGTREPKVNVGFKKLTFETQDLPLPFGVPEIKPLSQGKSLILMTGISIISTLKHGNRALSINR